MERCLLLFVGRGCFRFIWCSRALSASFHTHPVRATAFSHRCTSYYTVCSFRCDSGLRLSFNRSAYRILSTDACIQPFIRPLPPHCSLSFAMPTNLAHRAHSSRTLQLFVLRLKDDS